MAIWKKKHDDSAVSGIATHQIQGMLKPVTVYSDVMEISAAELADAHVEETFKSADEYGQDLEGYYKNDLKIGGYTLETNAYKKIKDVFCAPDPKVMKRVVDVFKVMHDNAKQGFTQFGNLHISVLVYYIAKMEIAFEQASIYDLDRKNQDSDYQNAWLLLDSYINTHKHKVGDNFKVILEGIKSKKSIDPHSLAFALNAAPSWGRVTSPTRTVDRIENNVYSTIVTGLRRANLREMQLKGEDGHTAVIEERATAIGEIHKGLVEVNRQFTVVAKLVEKQGELIDREIAPKIEGALVSTENGFNDCVKAKEYQPGSGIIGDFIENTFFSRKPKPEKALAPKVKKNYEIYWIDAPAHLTLNEKVLHAIQQYIDSSGFSSGAKERKKIAIKIKEEVSLIDENNVDDMGIILNKAEYNRPGNKTSDLYDRIEFLRDKARISLEGQRKMKG